MQTKQLTMIWLLLLTLTCTSWVLATIPNKDANNLLISNGSISALGMLIIAFIKVRMIIRYFMEVRTAPRWLKLSTDAWVFAMPVALYFLLRGLPPV